MSADRDFNTYKSILSGDIGVQNDAADNSYHVVRFADLDATVLDGFVIEDGNANGIDPEDQSGAGLLNDGQLVLKNSTIRNCQSIGIGTMINNDGVLSELSIQNVILIGTGPVLILNVNGATTRFDGLTEIRLE